VLEGDTGLAGQTIAISLQPSTDLSWVGNDEISAGTRMHAVLRDAPTERSTQYIAIEADIDNSRLTPFQR